MQDFRLGDTHINICPQCGREFFDGLLVPVWFDGKHFCTFTCQGTYEDEQKAKKDQQPEKHSS